MQRHVETYKTITKFIEKYGKASKEESDCVKLHFFSKNEEKEQEKVNNYKMTETNNILENLVNIFSSLFELIQYFPFPLLYLMLFAVSLSTVI